MGTGEQRSKIAWFKWDKVYCSKETGGWNERHLIQCCQDNADGGQLVITRQIMVRVLKAKYGDAVEGGQE